MDKLLRDCPFEANLTSYGSTSDCSEEVFPYKNLNEVVDFVQMVASGRLPPWLQHVKKLQQPTEYCYPHQGEVDNSLNWFPKARVERSSVPKTLLCHDYKGGYLEDRFVNGSDKYEAYNFLNWPCIDIFVYFSHHFVTVPPPSWINAAHLHGVPILGTLITEGLDGQKMWDDIFQSEQRTRWFADVLSVIASAYTFDGYLLNIENRLQEAQIPKLLSFIQTLKDSLKSRKRGQSYVIWYDSVTINGDLIWQNELNDLNKPFFDITDGIFLNYSWNERGLTRTREIAAERIHDVYVGVDVFGRNFFGGGGFNTEAAMKIIQKKNLSTAIFAFAWTHEVSKGNFLINDRIFWRQLLPFFNIHGTKQFPFKSDFSKGFGLKFYKDGAVLINNPWFDLAKQSQQNLYLNHENKENTEVISEIIRLHVEYSQTVAELKKASRTQDIPSLTQELDRNLRILYRRLRNSVVDYTTNDAFNGGGCVVIRPAMQRHAGHFTLFVCDLEVRRDWSVTTVTKSVNNSEIVDDENYPCLYVVLQTRDNKLVKRNLQQSYSIVSYQNGAPTRAVTPGWTSRKYSMIEKGRVIEIGVFVAPSHKEILLGEIRVDDW